MNTEPRAAWRRNPYVWMIIAIPMAAVVFGIYMITISITSNDGLVVDDYYKKGKEINMVLVRDELAAALGMGASISFIQHRVEVEITGKAPILHDEELELNFFNATRADSDLKVILAPTAAGKYMANIKPLPQGRWNVELGTSSWRLTGRYETGQKETLKLSVAQ